MPVPGPEHLREEMKRLVRQAAEPARPGESVKAEIGRAARMLGLSYGRVKRYWYGEIQVPPAHEVDAARLAITGRAGATLLRSERPDLSYRTHVVYDENGRSWPAGSPELREGLGYTVGDFDVGGFAVRCLGWVEVRHMPGCLHVRIGPRIVQPKALDALFQVLAVSPKVEVTLCIRDGQAWSEETLPSAVAALERIEVLTRGPQVATGDRFIAVRQPLSVLFRDKQRYLIEMLQQIHGLQASGDLEAIVRFAESDPTGRTGVAASVMAPKGETRTGWCVGYIGKGLHIYTDEDRRRLVGTDHANGPDREYGLWCQQGYDRTAAAREPIIEDVRALVFRRTGSPLEVRYRRLLVPIFGSNGETFIVCTTDLKQPQAA